MEDVIDISSSPVTSIRAHGRQNSHRSSQKARARNRAPFRTTNDSDSDVIDISSSDEDSRHLPPIKDLLDMMKGRADKSSPMQAGPSGLEPPHGPSRILAPRNGDSQAKNRRIQSENSRESLSQPDDQMRLFPLFLPIDDENGPPNEVVGTTAVNTKNVVGEPPAVEESPVVVRQEPKSTIPPPPPEVDPIDGYVAQVLEIIMDVEPDHVLALVRTHVQTYQDRVVEPVLHILFEDSNYPKVDRNGKRKRVENADESADREKAKLKIDYADKGRKFTGSSAYVDLALEQLLMDFPYIPKPHVRLVFFSQNCHYAPSYFILAEQSKLPKPPFTRKTAPSRPGKGKGKAQRDAELDAEREWLLLKLQEDAAEKDAAVAEGLNGQEYEECGDGIECGCCFSTYPFDKMIQCPEAHLFCTTCMSSYADNLLGEHNTNIVCMDQSGCKLAFTQSELSRFLTPRMMELYERVKQTKDIEAAGLEGLEECPFCEYKVVIENEEEKLFRCESKTCGAVSCRKCKKPDHLPKSCKEIEEDKLLDGRHAIEEAMTRALMRNCPSCQKAFIKEAGCNKMTCPNCRTLSCYICRQVVQDYSHFAQNVPNGAPPNSSKCILWDPVEQRHADEVAAAAKKAIEDYKRDHPDIDEGAIKVDLPAAPPPVVHNPQYLLPAQARAQAQVQVQVQIQAQAHAQVLAAHAQAAARAQAPAAVVLAQNRAALAGMYAAMPPVVARVPVAAAPRARRRRR